MEIVERSRGACSLLWGDGEGERIEGKDDNSNGGCFSCFLDFVGTLFDGFFETRIGDWPYIIIEIAS